MKNNTITVYWSTCATKENAHKIAMLQSGPVSIWKTLPAKIGENIQGNYRACKASLELFKNTYVLKNPQSSTLVMSGDYLNPELKSDTPNSWIARQSSFENTYAADYDFSWIFFAEESLKTKFTNAYMHKTEASKGGYLTSGSYDIGKWFRPLHLTYHLWENNNTLNIKENEPTYYIEFDTDKKVILKQFEIVEEIFQIAHQAVGFTKWVPNKSLKERYEVFIKSKRNKRLLKLIKENLLD